MTTALLLLKNILTPLAKSFLVPLALTVAVTVTDAGVQMKVCGLRTTILASSKEESNDIMEIVKHLDESDLLKKSASKKVKNEVKELIGGFLDMLTAILVATC